MVQEESLQGNESCDSSTRGILAVIAIDLEAIEVMELTMQGLWAVSQVIIYISQQK